ncbi:MAG: AI-2E family transporter, partial [Clostridia bacterium]|nr:AI-2E family transporter [Clostridia bacterium]
SKMNISKAIEDFIKSINLNEFSKYAQGVINLTSGVINTFIAIIVSVYMLIDKERIKKGIKSVFTVLFSEEKTERVSTIIANINNVFSKYIYCRVIDGLIMGILSIIILSLLGVRYALVLGTLVGFCNLIPYFGSIIGSVITTLITIVTGGFFKGLWTLITLTVLEQIDGNLIGPKIMGDVLEIRPLVIIFAVTVGGGLFGVLGMLFSVPIFVVLKMMGEEYLVAKQGEKEKKQL